MKVTSFYRGMMSFALFTALAGCGGGGSSANISDLDSLPQATSPVENGGSGAALVMSGGKSLATTGMPLDTTDEDDFSSTSSIAACEMSNMTKHAMSSAVQGDLILCYVTRTFGVLQEDLESDDNIDIYDGEYHVFNLDFTGFDFGEEEGPPDTGMKIKFKVVKNSAGAITNFEMFNCVDGTQTEYINQTISGNDFSMTSINREVEDDGTFAQQVAVSGTLSNGAFVDELNGTATPKEISMRFTTDSDTYGDYFGVMTFDQFSDHAVMEGYMSGSHDFEANTCTFTNSIYGAMQLLDGNEDGEAYDVGLLALGDGAVVGEWTGSCTGGGDPWSDTFEAAWLGDTRAPLTPATGSDFYDDVADHVLEDQSAPTINFGTGQTVDCSATAEGTIRFADLSSNPIEACANLNLNHNHIECWQIVEEGNGGGN